MTNNDPIKYVPISEENFDLDIEILSRLKKKPIRLTKEMINRIVALINKDNNIVL